MVSNTKKRVPYSTSLDSGMVERLKKLSDKTRIPAAFLLDEAIEDILKKYERRK